MKPREPWTHYAEKDRAGVVRGTATGPGTAAGAVRMAQLAARGMFWDGHIVIRAERLQNGIGMETACAQQIEIAIAEASDADRQAAKVTCLACGEATRTT